MKQEPLFRPPLHFFVADTLAAEAHAEIKAMAQRARAELEERFQRIAAFHARSLGQRRRFWRTRTFNGAKP